MKILNSKLLPCWFIRYNISARGRPKNKQTKQNLNQNKIKSVVHCTTPVISY